MYDNAIRLAFDEFKTYVSGHSIGGVFAMYTCATFDWVNTCYVDNPSKYKFIYNRKI